MGIMMVPMIDIEILAREINIQYGKEYNSQELTERLFGDEYENAVQQFYYEEDEIYREKFWENEEDISIRNLVRGYLRDVCPDYTHIFIDIRW